MTLEELQVIIEANTKGFKSEIDKVQNQVKKMTSSVNSEVNKVKSIFSGLARTVAAIGIGKLFLDSVKSAMSVEGAIQQITRTMGESTNSFLKWAKSSALAFNMSQADAMNYGATYSNLVSGFSSGTEQTMTYTTDLLKASSIIASGTGRTMTDVMERIRSGLLGNTEAIEDLGIYAQVGAIEATDAFKKLANGKSWDQLDYKTQQQIRLFSILEQTSSKFGGEVFNNTNSSLQQLVAILKDVALNLGNAFLPILNVVLPILSSFAMQLRTATSYVATFMQALFGKSSATSPITNTLTGTTSAANNATGALSNYDSTLADTGDTAKSTAKEMNRLLGGFDEINSLSDSGASGGGLPGSSGTGGGMSAVTPVIDNSGIDSSMMGLVDDIKSWFGSIDFSPLINSFNRVKEAISPIIDTIGNDIKWLLTDILAPFAEWTIEDALPAFFNLVAGALDVLNPLIESFSRVAKWLWDNFLQPIAAWTGGVIVDVLNGLAGVLSKIGDWMSNNQSVVDGITISVLAFMAAWKVTELLGFIGESGGVILALQRIAKALFATTALKIADKLETMALTAMYAKDFIVSIASGTAALAKQAFQWTISTGLKVADTIATGAMTVATGIWNVVCGIATGVTWAFGAAVAFLTSPIGLVILAIVAIIAIVVLLIKNWDTIKEVASIVWDKIVEVWNVVADWFYNNVIQPLADFFSGLWDSIVNIFTGVRDWFSNKFSEAWEAIKRVFSGIGSFFGGIWDTIKQQFTNIGSAIGDAIGGAFKYVVNSIINFAENTINGFIRAINGAIGMINKIPGVNINTINTMNIPRLAKGGIVDSAQMFVAGEAGKEAVMPLENNTGWITQLAEKVSSRMPQGADSSVSGDLILMIDGSVIGKVALSQLRKMQRQGNITLIPT